MKKIEKQELSNVYKYSHDLERSVLDGDQDRKPTMVFEKEENSNSEEEDDTDSEDDNKFKSIKNSQRKLITLGVGVAGVLLTAVLLNNKTVMAMPLPGKEEADKKAAEEMAKSAMVEADPKSSTTKKWIQRGRTICCVGLSMTAGLMGGNAAYLPNLVLATCCSIFMAGYATLGVVQRARGESTDPQD